MLYHVYRIQSFSQDTSNYGAQLFLYLDAIKKINKSKVEINKIIYML